MPTGPNQNFQFLLKSCVFKSLHIAAGEDDDSYRYFFKTLNFSLSKHLNQLKLNGTKKFYKQYWFNAVNFIDDKNRFTANSLSYLKVIVFFIFSKCSLFIIRYAFIPDFYRQSVIVEQCDTIKAANQLLTRIYSFYFREVVYHILYTKHYLELYSFMEIALWE